MEDLVFGIHAVLAALGESPDDIAVLWLEDKKRLGPRLRQIQEQAARLSIPVNRIPRAELDALAQGERHQGAAARLTAPRRRDEADLFGLIEETAGVPLLLVLDGVQDPHNLGACLRTADGAGVQAVIVPKDRAVGLTPTVRKVASGAAERLPLFTVTNLARTLEQLKTAGIWLVGLDGAAPQGLYDLDLTGPVALILGAEGKGLRRLTREACDHLARIPMAGGVESLNVSVSTGVALYEAVRQRARV